MCSFWQLECLFIPSWHNSLSEHSFLTLSVGDTCCPPLTLFQGRYWIHPYCPHNIKKLCLELNNVFPNPLHEGEEFFSNLYEHLPQVFTSKPVKERRCLYLTVIFYLCYYSNGFYCKEISHWKQNRMYKRDMFNS